MANSIRNAVISFFISFACVALLGMYSVSIRRSEISLLPRTPMYTLDQMAPGNAGPVIYAELAPNTLLADEPYPYYLDFPLKPASDLEDWRLDTPTTTGKPTK